VPFHVYLIVSDQLVHINKELMVIQMNYVSRVYHPKFWPRYLSTEIPHPFDSYVLGRSWSTANIMTIYHPLSPLDSRDCTSTQRILMPGTTSSWMLNMRCFLTSSWQPVILTSSHSCETFIYTTLTVAHDLF
jgi:hypothetical protein